MNAKQILQAAGLIQECPSAELVVLEAYLVDDDGNRAWSIRIEGRLPNGDLYLIVEEDLKP